MITSGTWHSCWRCLRWISSSTEASLKHLKMVVVLFFFSKLHLSGYSTSHVHHSSYETTFQQILLHKLPVPSWAHWDMGFYIMSQHPPSLISTGVHAPGFSVGFYDAWNKRVVSGWPYGPIGLSFTYCLQSLLSTDRVQITALVAWPGFSKCS